MPLVYEHTHVVAADEIDALGHANNLTYFHWMLRAALDHSASQGWPSSAYRALGRGWVVRSHTIKYLKSALAGDELIVRTWVAELKHYSCLRRYKIVRRRDDALLASASTEWAFIDYATGNLLRIPSEVVNAFELLPDDQTALV